MASTSVPTVLSKGDAIELEEHAACLLSVGESSDFEGTEAGRPRTCLGPFLKPEAIGSKTPLNYLITKGLPVIFRKGFVAAQNWNSGKGISNSIEMSLFPMEINSRVCAALLACWSPTLSCFMLPKGPLTVSLDDASFSTGCSPFGEPLRLHSINGDKFWFANYKISQTVAKYSSLKESYKLGYQEEFNFYLG